MYEIETVCPFQMIPSETDRLQAETGVLHALALADRPMIRLDNISKQNGHQILFIDASMGVQKGEKVGLVGPNGAGKTTLFRMITGQEEPGSCATGRRQQFPTISFPSVGHRKSREHPGRRRCAAIC